MYPSENNQSRKKRLRATSISMYSYQTAAKQRAYEIKNGKLMVNTAYSTKSFYWSFLVNKVISSMQRELHGTQFWVARFPQAILGQLPVEQRDPRRYSLFEVIILEVTVFHEHHLPNKRHLVVLALTNDSLIVSTWIDDDLFSIPVISCADCLLPLAECLLVAGWVGDHA